jgi:uncharacterized protein YabE (DUF348 family)
VPGPDEVWSTVLSILTGRASRLFAQGTVLAAVVGATAAYADSGTTLTLSVDGQARQIQAGATTVRELLAAEAIPLAAGDLVLPTPDTELDDGQDVVVRRARPLTLNVDGRQRRVLTTELTVDAALAALGVRTAGTRVSVPLTQQLGRDGLTVTVTTPKRVTLTADGATRTVTSTAATVAELLTEQGLKAAPRDRLSVTAGSPLAKDMTIRLVRIRSSLLTRTEAIPFSTSKKNDATLDAGTTKVITKGAAGARRATYTVIYADGKTIGRELTSAVITKQPKAAQVRVGTRPAPASDTPSTTGSAGSSGADGLNWAALADCESSGNPRAVNPAGYYGLYQFSLRTWGSVGGSGNPSDASPAEQTKRAKILYNKAGPGQWPVCGRKLFT